MNVIKKHLDIIFITIGTVIMAVGMVLLTVNLTNIYSAVDRLHTDSNAINALGGAEQTMHVSVALLIIGFLVLGSGIGLLIRRLARH